MTPSQYRMFMILIGIVVITILVIILYIVYTQKPTVVLKNTNIPPPIQTRHISDSTVERDRRVISDPLYPPLNRTESKVFNNTTREVDNRNLYVATTASDDSYRLVGYLTNHDSNKDAGGNNWKLFARMKDRNQADFYMIPANNNYDIKIPITNDMIVGDRLRDIYTIPGEMSYKSPMLNSTPYTYTELKRTDFDGSRYY